MWKILEKSSPFFIKLITGVDNFEILLTDFIHIWSNSFTKSTFISCLKGSNSLQFTNEVKLLERGMNLFLNPEGLESEVKIDEDKKIMSISLSTYIYGDIKFKLDCVLQKQCEKYYFLHITQPLLRTVKDLRTSESVLRNMLIDKDDEINKYKVQNVNILVSSKTNIFNDEVHSSNHKMYEETFGQVDIPDTILEKAIEIPEKVSIKHDINSEVTSEETIIKSELKSNTEDHVTITVKEEKDSIKTEPNRDFSMAKKRKNKLNY